MSIRRFWKVSNTDFSVRMLALTFINASHFDEDTLEFLNSLKSSTSNIYRTGLYWFQVYYAPRTIKTFLDEVEKDQTRPRRERRRMAKRTMQEFVRFIGRKSPKSVRAYVAAVQSMAQYFEVPFSLRGLNLPANLAQSKKFPWTLDKIASFVDLIEDPMYRALTVDSFQTGLGMHEILGLTYSDIKDEFESGVHPLCLDLVRQKPEAPFITFIGTWGIRVLKEYLADKNLSPGDPLFPVRRSSVDAFFQTLAKKFVDPYEFRNPVRHHTLRSAFRTFLGDQKVDPLYIEFWIGHSSPEQQKVYVSKSREGWRKTYAELAEPFLTPENVL